MHVVHVCSPSSPGALFPLTRCGTETCRPRSNSTCRQIFTTKASWLRIMVRWWLADYWCSVGLYDIRLRPGEQSDIILPLPGRRGPTEGDYFSRYSIWLHISSELLWIWFLVWNTTPRCIFRKWWKHRIKTTCYIYLNQLIESCINVCQHRHSAQNSKLGINPHEIAQGMEDEETFHSMCPLGRRSTHETRPEFQNSTCRNSCNNGLKNTFVFCYHRKMMKGSYSWRVIYIERVAASYYLVSKHS